MLDLLCVTPANPVKLRGKNNILNEILQFSQVENSTIRDFYLSVLIN
jgi:hypothetical protein